MINLWRKLIQKPLRVAVPVPTTDVFTFAQLDTHAGDLAAIWIAQGYEAAMQQFADLVELHRVQIIERKRLFNRVATLVAAYVEGNP